MMTKRLPIPSRRRARAKKRREGIVLLVVVTVLLLITSTAIFAVQQTMWEMRAGGSANQAMTTRYNAEAYATLGITALGSLQTRDLLLVAKRGDQDAWRMKYGVPYADGALAQPGSSTQVGFFSCSSAQFFCTGSSPAGPEAFPTTEIGPYEGQPGPYVDDSMVHVETWPMDSETPPRKVRHIVTSYGSMYPSAEADPNDADLSDRRLTESISISRAYYSIEDVL
jgi:hypothetical protein